jgi:hypothetical protein
MDRSQYRKEYDARKTLEIFSVKLRDETDLHALNNELAAWWGDYIARARPVVAAPVLLPRGTQCQSNPNLNSRFGSECLTAFDRNGCTYCRTFVVDFRSRGN